MYTLSSRNDKINQVKDKISWYSFAQTYSNCKKFCQSLWEVNVLLNRTHYWRVLILAYILDQINKSDFFVYSFFVQLNICTVACLENSYTIHNIFSLHGRYIFSYFNTCVKNSSLSLKFKLRNQPKRADTVWQVEMNRGQEKERWCFKRNCF